MTSNDPSPDAERRDAPAAAAPPARTIAVALGDAVAGLRLDKALARAIDPSHGLSRSRLRGLVEAGQVSIDGAVVLDPSATVRAGSDAIVAPPPPTPATPAAEAIPLDVVFEDAHLIVVAKRAGMAAHPAPGSETGTLVNALLAHCGDTLSGVGGEARPGIVHRIDKETSGLLVVAKTDAAHQGLAAQFAAHDLERSYAAVVWGAPSKSDPRLAGLPSTSFEKGWGRVETEIGRHRADRKRMAVVASGGRRAVTWFRVVERFGPSAGVDRGAQGPAWAARLECRLETGRTHQIRVHMSHIGAPLVGDPVYGRARTPSTGSAALDAALSGFPRQALHAATLGFRHPATGETMRFEAPPPDDLAALIDALRRGSNEAPA